MNEKIKSEHLQRAAYVYVRQSTVYQVRHHREGQQRQYDLGHRARQLGFEQIVVIDEDMGRSGSGMQERPGFGRLLAAVCQSLAGAVLALEASRLARNNRDWHHLVDLCALTQTLIIDDDGIYDPKVLNDRLLLGLKGTMSEFELGLMRQRARQAYMQKVRRGEAMWELPVGFVRSRQGVIEKTPDRQVQQAIEMVFAKFRQLGSARQTLIWLREQELLLPQAVAGSAGSEVLWRVPTVSRVHQILRNPCYAGAFAFGRTCARTVVSEGRIQRCGSRRHRPHHEWEVLIIDHHPGYIDWPRYLENRQLMAKNLSGRAGESSGAIRKGAALLSGLLRCGRCGRKMQAGYSGSTGKIGRYLCSGKREQRGSGPCLQMGSLKLDQAVSEQALEAIAPAGIEAAVQAAEAGALADQEKRRALELALQRARYEVQRARRQYDAVDPENRLVAGELEARWNTALRTAADLESRLQELDQQPCGVSAEQRRLLMEMGADLPRLWNDSRAPVELKKQILRTIIEEIVVSISSEPAGYRLQIHWSGGVHTELRVARNNRGLHRRRADGKVIELVEELVKVCDDKTIAGVLNRLGYRTGQGNNWSASRVAHFRSNHGMSGFGKREGWVTMEEAARKLEVSHTLVKALIRKRILPAKQVVPCAPWVIGTKDLELPRVQAAIRASKRGQRIPPTDPGQQQLSIE
jgi:DNA invertase Pin-like site-specific DNA recombinase